MSLTVALAISIVIFAAVAGPLLLTKLLYGDNALSDIDQEPATTAEFQLTNTDCPEGTVLRIERQHNFVEKFCRQSAPEYLQHGSYRSWKDGHPEKRAEFIDGLEVGTTFIYNANGSLRRKERRNQYGCLYEVHNTNGSPGRELFTCPHP